MTIAIDLSQIQRIVPYGSRARYVRHHVLTVDDPARAHAFFRTLESQVDFADALAPTLVAVAVTYQGLRALQLPDTVLAAFRELAPEFTQGAAARAIRYLGDAGSSEAAQWEGLFRSPSSHLVLTCHGESEEAIDARLAALRTGAFADALDGWNAEPLRGERLGPEDAPREHFGFRDGISQPVIKGVPDPRADRQPVAMHGEPGEFLLGHVDEDGANPWAVSAVSSQARDFTANGSFVAIRKIFQDVDRFRGLPLVEQARICGRWPNGAVLEPGAVAQPDSPSETEVNRFDYAADPEGQGCPFTAHIRRLSPRSDPVVPPRKRLLIRRGMPYGKADESERGLLGVFICASLARQFEFLLKDWGGEPPMLPGSRLHDPLFDYLVTRGTLYGFYPSRKALGIIGALS